LRRMLGENLRLGEPDASFFSSHKEERVGFRRAEVASATQAGGEAVWVGNPLSLPAPSWHQAAVAAGRRLSPARASRGEREPGFDRQFVIALISIGCWNNCRGVFRFTSARRARRRRHQRIGDDAEGDGEPQLLKRVAGREIKVQQQPYHKRMVIGRLFDRLLVDEPRCREPRMPSVVTNQPRKFTHGAEYQLSTLTCVSQNQ